MIISPIYKYVRLSSVVLTKPKIDLFDIFSEKFNFVQKGSTFNRLFSTNLVAL